MLIFVILMLLLPSEPLLSKGKIPTTSPFLRIETHIFYPKLNAKSSVLAFTNHLGQGLSIVNLQDGQTFRISSEYIGDAFFWAPDGARLFYREISREQDQTVSELRAYDTYLNKSVLLERYQGITSSIHLDPRDYRFAILSQSGIKTHRLKYPTERLAVWKRSLKTKLGYWLVAGERVFWVSNNGISMRPLGNEEKVYSYAISPDGRSIVWATQEERLYRAQDGERAQFLGRGTDPGWLPNGKTILFSKAKLVGDKIIDHDIAIITLEGSVKDLTSTPDSDERFPIWSDKSATILYTKYMSTDVFEMRFN